MADRDKRLAAMALEVSPGKGSWTVAVSPRTSLQFTIQRRWAFVILDASTGRECLPDVAHRQARSKQELKVRKGIG